MTADERLVLVTTIMLHGFQLYRQPVARDRVRLVGKPLGRDDRGGQMMYESVARWQTGEIAPTRSRTGWSARWTLLDWDALSDDDLVAFHDTVVSTC